MPELSNASETVAAAEPAKSPTTLLVVTTIQYGVRVAGFSVLFADAMPTVANMASPRTRAVMRWPNAWMVPLWM